MKYVPVKCVPAAEAVSTPRFSQAGFPLIPYNYVLDLPPRPQTILRSVPVHPFRPRARNKHSLPPPLQRGARKVVISDYATSTDNTLMVPIQINIDRVQPEFVPADTLHAVGHVWGQGVEDLFVPLRTTKPENRWKDNDEEDVDVSRQDNPAPSNSIAGGEEASHLGGGELRQETFACQRALTGNGRRGRPPQDGFDVVIMADLLFNRSQHAQLLETCDRCLRKENGSDADAGAVWVSFSHHDPEKAELDMKFFTLATEKGFVAKRVKKVRKK